MHRLLTAIEQGPRDPRLLIVLVAAAVVLVISVLAFYWPPEAE